VREYDHHCGVLGSCVGRRTFRFFAGFMQLCTLLCGVVFVRSVWIAAETDFGGQWAKGDNARWGVVATVGCILYTSMAGCMLVGNAALYNNYACRGITMKDMGTPGAYDKAQLFRRSANPVVECCCRYFGPMPPSRV
jgi:hypothetical protein